MFELLLCTQHCSGGSHLLYHAGSSIWAYLLNWLWVFHVSKVDYPHLGIITKKLFFASLKWLMVWEFQVFCGWKLPSTTGKQCKTWGPSRTTWSHETTVFPVAHSAGVWGGHRGGNYHQGWNHHPGAKPSRSSSERTLWLPLLAPWQNETCYFPILCESLMLPAPNGMGTDKKCRAFLPVRIHKHKLKWRDRNSI